ncbi:putative inactive lysine-specific demethylase JMJ19 [Raphanus sativus]|nr:putative inactive lysine-specific demethylase JMJ19 [Raphanus sativus]
MGIEGVNTSSKSGNVDKLLSPPPGFEGCSKSRNVDKLLSPPPGFEGCSKSVNVDKLLSPLPGFEGCSKSGNVDRLLSPPPGFESQTRFVLRKVQEQINGSGTRDADSFQKLVNRRPWIVHDHTTKPEVRPRRLPRVSKKVVLEEAPVFNPTEEEFNDTLSYISSLRDISEPHGICCVVPPPSWDPPCLLGERKTWEEFGHEYTLETFKNFADSYLERHFRVKEKVLASMYSSPSVDAWPTVADVEKEFRKLLENPLVELGVLYGNNIDTNTFSSGFPLSGTSGSCKYKTSGWNLNNTAKLPASLLSFDDCESVCVPRLSVGMCLSSQLWKSEKERLYSLCYLHTGAPRVWYSVAGCHRHKFKAFMESFIPKMSGEQSKKSYDSVMAMSPYALHMEGITVTLCVQNRGQYVILFPGTYYSSVDCGFNCLEIANFATLDWLSHKEVDALQNQEKKRKSLLSYDKLVWSCKGMFSNTVKSRVKKEKSRVQFLSGPLKLQRMDERFDDVSKRACCECFVDLYLSAVQCSCSADRYSCLSHMRNLCPCPYNKRSFLYRWQLLALLLPSEVHNNLVGTKARKQMKLCKMLKLEVREQMEARGKVRSIIEMMNVKEENDNE